MQLLNLSILVGTVQGIISSLLLFYSRKGNRISNFLLGTIILLISLACLNISLMLTGFRYISPLTNVIAQTVPLLIVMPLGPLIYFYVRSLADHTFKITKADCVHFLPIIIDLIPYIGGLTVLTTSAFDPTNPEMNNTWKTFLNYYDVYADMPRWVCISYYLYLSYSILRPGTKNSNSRAWAMQFVYVFMGFQLLWLLHLIPYVIPSLSEPLIHLVGWYPVYVPLAVMVYWLGINGYLKNAALELPPAKPKIGQQLSKEFIEDVYSRLIKAMEIDRLFLEPELNLDKMVRHTGIPQKSISSVLNQHIGESFNDFVNTYRVKEMQARLVDPSYEYLTIAGLALECGFNSQATMQRTFKQITGSSPKEYQLAHKPVFLEETP